jgi:hypothetical protein
MVEILIPMVRACAEIKCSYLAGRDLALKGLLDLRWDGSHMYVTHSSIERFKRQAAKEAPTAPPVTARTSSRRTHAGNSV